MKLGINVMADTGIHPDTVDYNWAVGMEGVTIPHDFEDIYDGLTGGKGGIILKPYLVAGNNATDVASAHYEFLTNHNPEWNNRVPLIIDTWTKETPRFDFDHIRVYLNYLYKYTEEKLGNPFKVKPLLKVTGGQWDSWYKSNRNEALKLLEHCDLLLAHWDAEQPAEVLYMGTLPWWEYQPGKIAYDMTGEFEGINVPEETEEPITAPVGEILISSPVKYKVTLTIFGIPITGTIEAVEE